MLRLSSHRCAQPETNSVGSCVAVFQCGVALSEGWKEGTREVRHPLVAYGDVLDLHWCRCQYLRRFGQLVSSDSIREETGVFTGR